ncbi:MAG: ammonium transporter [Candidatus Electrothrix aestuarii]|uniref:Ammonium transporter n=1 Tax=Candidatus Electrothrix aestuarii TaxID=3062594 RepID=A0AAU8LRU6_9BACT|nr:ammonium transporter [Candidatus Electrothrix aestuarii]WPD21877.1 MAG: ammonium transporter [Candidatus Electrothrix sp. GW3-3]
MELSAVNAGDTAFMMIAAALVMFMTPGLALFYGGLVRSKNVLSTVVQSFFSLGIVGMIWVVYGYSLAFGPDVGGLIGNLDWAFLRGVGMEPSDTYATTIPHLVFCAFQLMFASITPALITGAFAERIKFTGFLFFTVVWTTIVYLPVCHWVWGSGGWLLERGALDFAGGTVIHLNSGMAALVAAIFIGKRKGHGQTSFMPHSLGMTILGAGILWFGWFGFNAGSATAANGIAGSAFFITHIAAAAAMVSWVVAEWMMHGKPTALGAASGAVAGLVAITPAAGFVGPVSAVIIGLIGGVLCLLAINLKNKFKYDDALDVVAVHGCGGTWGAVATGLFASTAINPGGADGLFFGGFGLVFTQIEGVLVTFIYSGLLTYGILKVTEKFIGFRVSEEDEVMGLDLSQHDEVGYNL